MINKTIYIHILFFLFLTSCDEVKIKNPNQCLGEWKLLDDDSHEKSFILKENGKAEFNNLFIKDIEGEIPGYITGYEEVQIPKDGTWKIVSIESHYGSFLEIWFHLDGGRGDYGSGGKLVKKNKALEVWFTVGDPDDFKWKRFRLVNPYYTNSVK